MLKWKTQKQSPSDSDEIMSTIDMITRAPNQLSEGFRILEF